jgi:hypothetical protein
LGGTSRGWMGSEDHGTVGYVMLCSVSLGRGDMRLRCNCRLEVLEVVSQIVK